MTTTITHKVLKQDAYDLHYYVSGEDNDKVILFLHPAYSDHRAFDLQVDFFSKNYKVIRIDLVGHGFSKVKSSKDKLDVSSYQISKIIDIECDGKIHLVGVSMGALIAQDFAIKHPQKIQSLCSLGAYDISKKNKEVSKAQFSSNLRLVLRALFSMNAFRKEAANLTCHTLEGKAFFYKTMSHYQRKSFVVMQGLQNIIKERQFAPPSYPNLILSGEYDIDLVYRLSKDWSRYLKNSEHIEIKGAGHCANIDTPQIFNKTLNDFLNKASMK